MKILRYRIKIPSFGRVAAGEYKKGVTKIDVFIQITIFRGLLLLSGSQHFHTSPELRIFKFKYIKQGQIKRRTNSTSIEGNT